MKIALVGSSSEVGQLIQKKVLLKNNYDYVRFGRTEDRMGSLEGIPFCQYDLFEDRLNLEDEFDYVIYCAYDFKDLRDSEENINYRAIKKIAFHKNCKLIYTSSVLAENKLSLYGQVKNKIEYCVNEIGGYSLRIGVIKSDVPISNIKLLSNLALKMKFLVLPGINSQILVSNDEKIAETITNIIDNKNLVNGSSIIFAVSYISTLKTCIKEVTGNRVMLINFPIYLLNPLFYLSSKTRILQNISDKFENLKLAPHQYSSWRPGHTE